jgi:hypothetical protein
VCPSRLAATFFIQIHIYTFKQEQKILKWILNKTECDDIDWIRLRMRWSNAGSCQHDKEYISDSKEGEEFLDQLSNCYFMNKDYAPLSSLKIFDII